MAGEPDRGRAAPGARRTTGRRSLRLALALLTAATLLFVRPAAADAHAELVSSDPASGAHLDAPPSKVTLTFTESVEMPDDAVEVLAASGDRVDTPDPAHPSGDRSVVELALPDLDDGAYVVSWKIISEDSHPISGAFTFAVGNASAADADAVVGDVLAGDGAARSLGVVFGIDRFLAFAGMVLLVGGIGFLLTLWPAGLDDRRARRLVAGAWWATFLATVAGIALQAAYTAAGSLADVFDVGAFLDEFSTRAGRIWLARLVLLVVLAVAAKLVTRPLGKPTQPARGPATPKAVPRVPDEVTYVAAALGLALLGTISWAGHASSGRVVPLAMVTDLVHLAGVSAWLGGLTLLVVAVLRPGEVTDEGPTSIAAIDRVVGTFSTVAFGAVVAIVVSGVIQAWRQLGTLSALWDTTYGRLLMVKVALFAAMLVGAYASRAWVRRNVGSGPSTDGDAGTAEGEGEGQGYEVAPALSPGPGAVAAGTHRDLKGLRRSVAVEVAIAVLVLAVTAGLVESVPGKNAGASGPFTTEQHGNEVLVDLTVDPTSVGPVDITIEAQNHDGTPADPEEVTASLRLPDRDLGPIDLTLDSKGDGVYTSSGAELPFAGAWELLVNVRTSDVDQDSFTATFNAR